MKRLPLSERFWSKVDKRAPNECWPWIAARFPNGYGKFWIHGQSLGAHRAAWELEHGPIPAGLFVCHNCPGGDDPRCVNPAHLFLGTQLENQRDCVNKNRKPNGDRHYSRLHPERLARGERNGSHTHPERRPRGESQGLAKLTESQVIEIRDSRASGASLGTLARRFAVSKKLILDITQRKTWRHVA